MPEEASPTPTLDSVLGGELSSPDGVGAALARCHWTELESVGMPRVAVVLDWLPDEVLSAFPSAGFAAARLAESQVEIELRARILDRLEPLVHPEHELSWELLAERARDLARDGCHDDAERLATQVIDGSPSSALLARGRALSALGLSRLLRGDRHSLLEAERRLTQAIEIFQMLGEERWEANAQLQLGYGVEFRCGVLFSAAARLARAVSLLGSAPRERGRTLTFLAEIHTYVGDYEPARAALVEVMDLGRQLTDHLLLGYGAWSWARWSAQQGLRDATLDWLVEAERHSTDWFDHLTGAEFLAAAAELSVLVSEPSTALRYLERAETRASDAGHPDIVWFARSLYELKFGDPGLAATLLRDLENSAELADRNRWRVLALRSQCAERLGDDEAGLLAERARAALERLGHLSLVDIHEPEWAIRVRLPPRGGAVELRLLGGFECVLDGVQLRPAAGHPSTLLKLVALRGRVAIDESAEILWPDVEPATGRRRLRNVLLRLRSSCPGVVIRDGEDLVLAPAVAVDAAAFEDAATTALASGDPLGAQTAFQMYRGELLPGDRYEDWSQGPRERVRRLVLDLLDLLVEDAVQRDDIRGAVRLLDTAIAIEPLDERRHFEAARLLIERGELVAAREFLRRAGELLDELGVTHPPELTRLIERSSRTVN